MFTVFVISVVHLRFCLHYANTERKILWRLLCLLLSKTTKCDFLHRRKTFLMQKVTLIYLMHCASPSYVVCWWLAWKRINEVWLLASRKIILSRQQITLIIKHADAHNYPFFAKKYLLTGKKLNSFDKQAATIGSPMFANYFASGLLQNYHFSYLLTLRTWPVRTVSQLLWKL